MKKLLSVCVALAIAGAASLTFAEDKSGLQVGEQIGAFTVEKVGGNDNDGVADGSKLCYRCRMGSRPVVTVFTRSNDANVAKLVVALDKVVADHADQKAAAFVNVVADDQDAAKKNATTLIEEAKTGNVAVVVLDDVKDTTEKLKLNPETEVTVLMFNKGTITGNYAVSAKDLGDKVSAIVADAEKMLKE